MLGAASLARDLQGWIEGPQWMWKGWGLFVMENYVSTQ